MSSQFIFVWSRRMLILMAARQAMEAAMPRRRSSTEALRSSCLGDFEDLVDDLLEVGGAHVGGRGFHGDGAVAEGLGLEARGVQLVGDARVLDLLVRR